MYNEIISYITKNRISTTEVADCLGKNGAINSVMPLNQGLFVAGKVKYIYGHSESNWSIHEQAQNVCEGDVVIIDGIDVNDRALFGELVTKFLVLYKGAKALVALGKIRDANDIIKNRYPVWACGVTPIGCFNNNIKASATVLQTAKEHERYYNDSIAVCDDTGVVIVPKKYITTDFLDKLHKIEEQEDTWFDCIDRLKWSTYDTVCLKKYLN